MRKSLFSLLVVTLLFGFVALSYGEDAITSLGIECEVSNVQFLIADVTVKGTIRANIDLKDVKGWLTINGRPISEGLSAPLLAGHGYVGGDSLGDLSAGQTKSFSITENVIGVADGDECGVYFEYREVNSPPQPEDAETNGEQSEETSSDESELKIVVVVNYPSPPIGYTVSSDLIVLEDRVRFVVGIAHLHAGKGGCISIGRMNGVQHTIHNSKWMRRDNATSPWSDVPDTENDRLCFEYSPTSAGEYIFVVEISIDGVRKKYASATLLRVTGDLPSTSTITTTEPDDDDTTLIPDPNLAAAIREEIGNAITKDTLLNLTRLEAPNRGITDLTGLEHAHNLTDLWLWQNSISDVSPLAELTQLTRLKLSSNNILDVSPIVGLNLTGTERDKVGLDIRGNPLNAASINTYIPAMRAKGIVIVFEVFSVLTQGAGEKIVGPWLWVIAPTGNSGAGAAISEIDFLSQISGGSVTELAVATNGVTAGTPVGDSVWTLHTLSLTGSNNINDMVNAAGLGTGNIDNHVAYGSIALDSPRQQQTKMFVGSDDAVKVWLNGELVHNNPVDRAAPDFQDSFPVTLKKGTNILLVAVYEGWGAWSGFFGFAADADIAIATEVSRLAADVNGDGIVNIQDLVLVSSSLGQTGESSADVNGDGVVNIQDLVLVAGAFGEGPAASPTLHPSDFEGLTAAEVQDLLTQARQMALTDPAYLRGIAVLEQLLALLLPKETALLPNYPNPFNPETWIPYQLAKPADVTLTIYDIRGRVVRILDLGHQRAGLYQSRSRAAYWDGRNAVGERVASGLYFYTLTAGNFSATRKMLIRK